MAPCKCERRMYGPSRHYAPSPLANLLTKVCKKTYINTSTQIQNDVSYLCRLLSANSNTAAAGRGVKKHAPTLPLTGPDICR